MADGAATFVLDMGEPVRIVDLVENFARLLSITDLDLPVHRPAARREAQRGAVRRRRGPGAHRRTRGSPWPRRRMRGRGLPGRAPATCTTRRATTGPTRCSSTSARLVPEYAPTTRLRARPGERRHLPRRLLSEQAHRMTCTRPSPTSASSTAPTTPPDGVRRRQPSCRQTVTRSRRWVVGVGGADLAAPPVVLPDFHHKSKMELPSSVAVATNAPSGPT